MDSTNFPIPYSNQGATDDAHTAEGLLNIIGLFFEDAGPAGLSSNTVSDLLKVLDQARELLGPVLFYLDDNPQDLEAYRQARRKHIMRSWKGSPS